MVLALILLAACGPSTSSPGASTAGTPGLTATASVATPAPTVEVAPTDTPLPSIPPASIVSVECLTGLTVRIHIRIASEAGIVSYQVWSTWGGGGNFEHVSEGTLPTEIDEVVDFTHTMVDPEASRTHQYGLSVMLHGQPDPILTYGLEPDGRCPGH